MAKPWEKYSSAPAPVETASGPWAKYSAPTEDKSLLRRGAEAIIDSPALPIAGAVGGAALGAGVGSIPLAGLGAAGMEGYRQLAARKMGLDVPETSLEAAKDIGIQGGLGMAGEGAGQLAGAALRPIGNLVKSGIGKVGEKFTRLSREAYETALEKPLEQFTAPFKRTVKKAYEKAGFPLEKKAVGEIITDPKAVAEVVERGTSGSKKMLSRGGKAVKEYVETGNTNPETIFRGRQAIDKDIELLKNQINLAKEKGESASALQKTLGDKFELRRLFNEVLDRIAPVLRKADALASRNLSVAPFRQFFLPGNFHFMSPRGWASVVPGVPYALGAATSALGAGAKAIGRSTNLGLRTAPFIANAISKDK